MTINKDLELPGQQAMPAHPASAHARSDADRVAGEEVLQTPDYNAPPSSGAIKSTGAALDPGVGGALGMPPPAARTTPAGSTDNSDAELGENQGGGDQIADEVKAHQE
ncbi:hypothetical protein [Massilia sp. PWRC2]|uniref:hypothetical protein n=1 Tax=Massilia sp. PWRC2 TaxID=2804626 RepID=UPI003CF10E7C